MSQAKLHWRLLTVGDGDMTLSLAIARAYTGDDSSHAVVSLTASVLDTKDDLLLAFPDAPIAELEKRGVEIIYGCDATQLHKRMQGRTWDLVVFHHPHLGLASLNHDEAEHAQNHYQLLSHYLYSASSVAKLVHLCLCGSQRSTWRMDEAAERQGLRLARQLSTTVPFSKLWTNVDISATEARAEYAAPRKYRFGKLGSRHSLGKYGYRHRRTAGERYQGGSADMDVSGSMHYVFEPNENGIQQPPETSTKGNDQTACTICGTAFESMDELEAHLAAPALPQHAELSNAIPTMTSDDSKMKMDHMAPPCRKRNNADKISLARSDASPPDHQQETQHATKEFETIVQPEHEGRRLRWFLKTTSKLSKSQADTRIRSGCVKVDNFVVADTSRILKAGMSIVLYENSAGGTASTKKSMATPLEVIFQLEPYLVVAKPSGMRTKGNIPGSLEFLTAKQLEAPYECLSRLDTSTAGLCVLVSKQMSSLLRNPSRIMHSMVALVHGRVPDSWLPKLEHTTSAERKWKKRKHGSGKDADEITTTSFTTTITIIPMERSTAGSTDVGCSLSTVRIETDFPSAASICHAMRNLGHPVVGDSNCRGEYLELKRSIRNRIKNRICLVCHQVSWQGNETNEESIQVPRVIPPIPDRLSANNWEKNFGATEPPNAELQARYTK